MKIVKSDPISVSEAKEMLEKREKEGELNYEQTLAMEHTEKFASDKPKAARKKIEEIIKKNEKIPPETAVKIIDMMPKNISTLKAIMLKDKVELSDEELAEVLKLVG